MLKDALYSWYYFLFGYEVVNAKKESSYILCLRSSDNSDENKIPSTVNYVQITDLHKYKKDALNQHFLHCELKHNLEILPGYNHVIWTDNPQVVQAQIDYIGYKSVEVKNVFGYGDEFLLWKKYHDHFSDRINEINSAYKRGNMTLEDYLSKYRKIPTGQALAEVDFLKYSILKKYGGIIADLNFQFKSTPYETYMSKCEFFYAGGENSFFASKKNGQAINEITNECDNLINNKIEKYTSDNYFIGCYAQVIGVLKEKTGTFFDKAGFGYDLRHQEPDLFDNVIGLAGSITEKLFE